MVSCNSCGVSLFGPDDNDGYCDDCYFSEATCTRCYEEFSFGDLDSDGVCGACHNEHEQFLECDSCGNTMEEDEAGSFDGVCELCASQGY